MPPKISIKVYDNITAPPLRGFFIPLKKFLISHREQKGTFPLQLNENHIITRFLRGTFLEQNHDFRNKSYVNGTKNPVWETKLIVRLPHYPIVKLLTFTP